MLESAITRENLFFASFLGLHNGICVLFFRYRNKFLPLSFSIKVFRRFGSVLEGFRLCKIRDLVQKSTEFIKNREMTPIRLTA